jgi:hypothetical protein
MTIVQKIEWDGPKHPKAEIHGHVVVVPDFGKIYFGEMFIAALPSPDYGALQLGSPMVKSSRPTAMCRRHVPPTKCGSRGTCAGSALRLFADADEHRHVV